MSGRTIMAAAAGCVVLLMTASAKSQDAPSAAPGMSPADQLSAAMDAVPEGMFPLPVLATRAEVRAGDLLPVCLYHGARPRELTVISQTCGTGEEHCTVMVAVPRKEPFAFREFNAANPPVATPADGQCERPYRAPIAGVLGASR